jgi:hypothetical protein
MSLAADPKPPLPTTASRAVSRAAQILSVLAVATATAAVVVSLMLSSPRRTGDLLPAADVNPLVQQGAVKPEGQPAGTVFYPVPYATPPHLTLSPAARYCLARQDELGFTWVDRQRLRDSPDLAKEYPDLGRMLGKEVEVREKADGPQPELTWEARGVRAGTGAVGARLFQQTGSFQCPTGGEGEVYFPLPYESPPNVELTSLRGVTVTACTPLGFAWKATADGVRDSRGGAVTWTAKGVKASTESYRAEVTRLRAQEGPMPGRLLRQEGTFAPVGTVGEVYFPHPYASPPNVEFFYEDSDDNRRHATWATVRECKATGFQWKVAEEIKNPKALYWVAKGRPASEEHK